MPTTPKGYPYPTPDDPVALGANDIRALAEHAETLSLARAAPGLLATGEALAVGQDLWLNTDTGRLAFGATADTFLTRPAPNVLKTDGQIYTGSYIAAFQGTPQEATIGNARLILGGDTNLYRAGGGVLKTDGYLTVGAGILVDANDGGARINFGSAADTSLYRVAGGHLQTESLHLSGSLYVQEGATPIELTGGTTGPVGIPGGFSSEGLIVVIGSNVYKIPLFAAAASKPAPDEGEPEAEPR